MPIHVYHVESGKPVRRVPMRVYARSRRQCRLGDELEDFPDQVAGHDETIGSAEDTAASFGGKYGGLYPTSVAVLRSGAIYVGMRHFVTRLTPKGSSYAEDWLVPSNCLRFVDLGFQFRCACGGLPKELLKERLTLAEAEARLKPGFAPFREKAWDNLRHQMQPGDELWTWRHSRWAGGIALVRNGGWLLRSMP